MDVSEALPHIAEIVDELCFVRSMHTEHNNHLEGLNMLLTCKIFPGRPVMGAWISYALGTENQSLPAYVVLRDPTRSLPSTVSPATAKVLQSWASICAAPELRSGEATTGR
jgi:hypothetical protein